MAALLAALDANDVIDAVTTADDATSSKPAADIIHVALEKAGLGATEAVFVGDAVWDGYACAKAAVPFIGLACGGTSAREPFDAGAMDVYDDPAALLSALDRSILAPA